MSSEAALFDYNLQKPHPRINVGGRWIRFKETYTTEGVLYVPTYISPLKKRPGWRVRLNLTVPKTDTYVGGPEMSLHNSLQKAWRLVVEILTCNDLRPAKTKNPLPSSLNTGVKGVNIARNKNNDSILLRVSQSLMHERAYHITFYSQRRYPLSREAFERQYRMAIAARRYYEFLRLKHYRLHKPITPSTSIPPEFYPKTLPVPDLYDRFLECVSKKRLKGSEIQGPASCV